MHPRISTLCLFTLTALFASATGATAGDESPATGEVQLHFATDQPSFLPIDIEALTESRCQGGTGASAVGECRLKIDSGGVRQQLTSGAGAPPYEENLPSPENLQWSPLSFDAIGQSVSTSCGTWDVSLSIDPLDRQIASRLALQQSSSNPGQGFFASVVYVLAHLHIANQGTNESYDYLLQLAIDFDGPWTVTSSGFLFLPDGGCVPVTVVSASDSMGPLLANVCKICFGAWDGSNGNSSSIGH